MPKNPHTILIESFCRKLEQQTPAPTLAQLASLTHLSPSALQRQFKAVTGVSPRVYAAAARRKRLAAALVKTRRVADAVFDAGYEASSTAYRDSQALGLSPAKFKHGAVGETIVFACAQSSLGPVVVAQTDKGVCAVEFVPSKDAASSLQERFPNAHLREDRLGLRQHLAQITKLIDRPDRQTSLPLDIRGTAFQVRVWEALRRIPIGTTLSYSELAQAIQQPKAVRAVASACAANKLAVVVPCHRVVRNNGDLSGYRWGVDRKRNLLARERTAPKARR